MYFAHSGNHSDRSDWQSLPVHLENVACIAEKSAAVFGAARAGRLAGLFHDLGKYTAAFQDVLAGKSIRVDHSTAGAAMILDLAKGRDRGIAQIIAYAIAGHHAGLPDMLGPTGAALSQRLKDFEDRLAPEWTSELVFDCTGLEPGLRMEKSRADFQYAFFGRMIFSCLVDADFRDTEAYYARIGNLQKDRQWPALQDLLPGFVDAVTNRTHGLAQSGSPVNGLRREVLIHVRSRAGLEPGLFTLTVPTGGGKTLASLAFALDHAMVHGHRRIIYAIPFTSIIDQTAALFKEILGSDHVLEHHSAIEVREGGRDKEQADKLKLAMEDWAAPVVVTTNVQFFESLFAARTSASRKIHNIANSIIILDEAQTLPRRLLAPCARVLEELARNYGCSIVLCTATQPALDERNFRSGHAAGLKLEGRELAPDPEGLAVALRRVTVRRCGEMSNDDLVEALRAASQGLIVVNSRKHALALFNAGRVAGLDGMIHLTTRQYAAHRRELLDLVRQRLKDGLACRVIATSLVEAGVDLDFPRVWRAESGLDQIAQAAGRCNREGRHAVEDSIVTVFASREFPPPAEIKALSGDMSRILAEHGDDLLSPAAIAAYFDEVYWRLGEDGLDAKNILSRFRLERNGTDFAYRSVAADFRMIESGMEPVIIPRHSDAEAAVKKLGLTHIGSGSLARELQSFVVQVPPKARERLIANGHVSFHRPNLRGDQFAVLDNGSLYKGDIGLLWEDAEYLSMEQSMI